MKSTILIAVLAGAAAGGGAALLAGSILKREPLPVVQAVSPDDGLADALRRVEQQGRALEERLRGVETQLALVRPQREVAHADPEPSEAAMDEELKELVAALRDPDVIPPQNFQDSVSRALQNIREQEERDRDERRKQAFEQRLDERLAEIALELGLTKNQTDGLRSMYLELDARREQSMSAAREAGDWGSMRDTFREMRDEMDQTLARLLTPDQLERYRDVAGGFGGWGGPGGGFLPGGDRDDRGRGDRGRGDESNGDRPRSERRERNNREGS